MYKIIMMRAPLLGVDMQSQEVGRTRSWSRQLWWQSESKVRRSRVDNINVEIAWQAVPVSENEAYCMLVRNALGKRVSSAKRANGYCILARVSAFLTRSDTLSFTRADVCTKFQTISSLTTKNDVWTARFGTYDYLPLLSLATKF